MLARICNPRTYYSAQLCSLPFWRGFVTRALTTLLNYIAWASIPKELAPLCNRSDEKQFRTINYS